MPNIGPVELIILLMIALLFVVPIYLIYAAARAGAVRAARDATWEGPSAGGSPAELGARVVRERFVRGEITREQYEAGMDALGVRRNRDSGPSQPAGASHVAPCVASISPHVGRAGRVWGYLCAVNGAGAAGGRR